MSAQRQVVARPSKSILTSSSGLGGGGGSVDLSIFRSRAFFFPAFDFAFFPMVTEEVVGPVS